MALHQEALYRVRIEELQQAARDAARVRAMLRDLPRRPGILASARRRAGRAFVRVGAWLLTDPVLDRTTVAAH